MSARVLSLAALTAAGAVACGGASLRGPAFKEDWQDDGGRAIAGVAARLESTKLPESKGLVLGVTKSGLVGMGLDGSGKWSHAGLPDSRPAIAGSVVVYTAGGQLVGLDGTSGKELWHVAVGADKRLRGAGDDGTTTVATVAGPSGGGTVVVAVGRGANLLQSWTPDQDVGVPGVAGGTVFAPWNSQYVSALDVASGDEIGRVLARTVVSRAVAIGGSLYFGESALVKFDSAISLSAKGEAHVVKLPERELPGKPTWFPSGVTVLPANAGAPDAIRFYARPAERDGKLAIDSERFAATYFRIAVGFDSVDGALRWTRTLPAEVIGGDAATNGFAFCDVNGDVWLADARAGGAAGKASVGQPLEACVVSAGAFQVGSGSDTGSLTSQITEAIELRDAQMATVQRFLLRELGTNENDPGVTKTLLDLASDARTQPEVLAEARSLLAARRNGVEFMLQALERHYDFLSDVLRPPPVGPLADALAAVGEKRAAPLLAAHLNDPSDTPNDARHAAHALLKLATGDELAAVKTFFSLYHSTANEDDLVAAAVDAARILVKLGGPDGTAVVQQAARDPLTIPAVREAIASLAPAKPG
ncbi:MAG TPA: PQQ-binding-like beta-propeller repeat protein [Polyangiaceae bacterium]|jgi:outer membrane protein assembly factor BamB|nr:PQQ-binding-like beta-propeller repeat protein [Polyangiaceae bacterium]